VPFLNDGRGYPDDGDSILFDIPVLSGLFYHDTIEHGFVNDKPDKRIRSSGDPCNRVPFYPQIGRMKRIR
jgi:hypothetical protein